MMGRGVLLMVGVGALTLVAGAQAADDVDVATGIGDNGFFDDGVKIGIAAGGTGLVVIAGALWFLGVGGLRHVDSENVLEHPLRSQILETVKGRPGIHLRELSQMHATAVTNTQWHLRKLEMAGLVRTQKVSGRRLFYPTQGGIHSREEALHNAATRNPNAESIFGFIATHAGCNQRSLADGLAMNPGTVRWHLRRLEDAGLIHGMPDGANTRYYSLQRPPRPRRNA
jgi:predicted transcriptional regulator